jgi:N-acetyl-beta-hexosaminidase
MPTIQGLLNSQGYTPQQQSAITQRSLGASNTAFDALRERAADRTTATNNSAVYDDLTAQLGRQQAQSDASKAQQNQITFANQQLKEQLAGLSALGQTYGVDTNLLGKAVGVPAGFAAADFRYWTVTVAAEVVRPNSFVALSV